MNQSPTDKPVYQQLNQRIAGREAVVGIIGLGYVGLPLMRAFWAAGLPVIGFDVDPVKIEKLHRGENYLKHLGEDWLVEMVQGKDAAPAGSPSFDATSDFARLNEADVILICVPTPLGQHLEPDLSYVEQTAEAIARAARPGQLIVLESTTYPGTTRQIVLPPLLQNGLVLGSDVFVAYSPEREDPGRTSHSTQTIPKLVGGLDDASGHLAMLLYQQAVRDVIPVSRAEVAEAAKLLENIYRAVNIALVNEMKVVLQRMDIDVFEVIDAAATKPFGFQAFYPGPGLGGHCIPIDPYYLTWKAREVGESTRFIELAGEVNRSMPEYVVQRTLLALNDHGKAMRGARVLVLGLAYKPDVDDVRESPSFDLIQRYLKLGAQVDYHDPHVAQTHAMRHYADLPPMKSIELSNAALADHDVVVIATHHKAYDWQQVVDHAPLIVDTRHATRGYAGQASVFYA